MGDFGFKGAGEFGGTSVGENFHCLSDFDSIKCPYRKHGLNGDSDFGYSCEKTGRADVDGRGRGYDPCSFVGLDYRECHRYNGVNSRGSLKQ